jgi:acyl-coenzyme A synthetase/AMP-(fatty) acid ligase
VLIQLLRAGAQLVPEQPVVLTPERTVSYASCATRSEDLGQGLLAHSVDRFACVVADVADLLALLCASTAVAAEACVYPANADDSRVAELAAMFDHRVVVSDRDMVLDNAAPVRLSALPTDGELPPVPARAPTLILTTGTTGAPKGVRHDWGRLAAAVPQRDARPGERWLLAYNLNQFAGTQMLLHVLTARATLVAPSSNEPRAALQAMQDLEVTHASATPTFWRFVTGLLDDKAAARLRLEQITLGGEAVPARLLADLHRTFPKAKISQVYAATEFGSTVSVRDARNGLPASVLERDGETAVQMKIVDGQLYTRSRLGMIGYYGEPDVVDGEWRPTGDLVEQRDDRVFFVGRTSETINVGGVKVHPLPVEELVSNVDGVELAHAYGRPNAMTGQIVAVDVVAKAGRDRDELEDAIREACEPLPAAAQPRRIRFVESLDVAEHKVSRRRPEAKGD